MFFSIPLPPSSIFSLSILSSPVVPKPGHIYEMFRRRLGVSGCVGGRVNGYNIMYLISLIRRYIVDSHYFPLICYV